MSGGLLQIGAWGAENQDLMGNPQITFFKSVYKRFTNFSIETIDIPPVGINQLSWDTPITLKTKIPRNADLLSDLYLRIDLPDIYSPSNDAFQWIDGLGEYIIQEARCLIGGELIERLDSRYCYIMHKYYLSDEKSRALSRLTGITPENNDPSLLNNNYYPGYDASANVSINGSYGILNQFYTSTPSIRGRSLYIPLPFWFTRNIGSALPLIALQYHEVEIEIDLRPIYDLYTVQIPENYSFRTHNQMWNGSGTEYVTTNTSYIRQRPTLAYHISKYINPPNVITGTSWALNPMLLGNYIFLDDNERKVFAGITHKYLYNQNIRTYKEGQISTSFLDLEVYHAMKEIVFVGQRNDTRNRNTWTNFSNLDYRFQPVYKYQNYYWKLCNDLISAGYNKWRLVNNSGVVVVASIGISFPTNPFDLFCLLFGPYGLAGTFTALNRSGVEISIGVGFTNPIKFYIPLEKLYTLEQINEFRRIWEYRSINPLDNLPIPIITNSNYEFYNEKIFTDVLMNMNGNAREKNRESEFWDSLQPYWYHDNPRDDNVMFYSFSLNPDKYQPSGACNFTRLKDVQFQFTIKTPPIVNSNFIYTYDINMYTINYNIVQFMAGMGGLIYAN